LTIRGRAPRGWPGPRSGGLDEAGRPLGDQDGGGGGAAAGVRGADRQIDHAQAIHPMDTAVLVDDGLGISGWAHAAAAGGMGVRRDGGLDPCRQRLVTGQLGIGGGEAAFDQRADGWAFQHPDADADAFDQAGDVARVREAVEVVFGQDVWVWRGERGGAAAVFRHQPTGQHLGSHRPAHA